MSIIAFKPVTSLFTAPAFPVTALVQLDGIDTWKPLTDGLGWCEVSVRLADSASPSFQMPGDGLRYHILGDARANTIYLSAQRDDYFHEVDAGGGNDNVIGSTGADWVQGGFGDDVIIGMGGKDLLVGGAGNDEIWGDAYSHIDSWLLWREEDNLAGGSGDDFLHGGVGADTIDGGGGVDTSSYEMSEAGVTVDLSTGRGTGGAAQGDTLRFIENLVGSMHGDVLIGASGRNVLNGGDGADVLIGDTNGSTGGDLLIGGAGADTFRFTALTDSGINVAFRDTIQDFTSGDRIDVSAIDAQIGRDGNQAFVLDAGGAFSAGEIRQRLVAGGVYLEFNADAAANVEMSLFVANRSTLLSAADFIL
jgi:Ca2+-binding RTX toxin-like protein